MLELALKAGVAGILVAAASEVARRSTAAGAVLISLPIASLLAVAFLWIDTHDRERVSQFAWSTMLIVVPSQVVFILLVVLLRRDVPFWPALGASMALMVVAYAAYAAALGRLGVRL